MLCLSHTHERLRGFPLSVLPETQAGQPCLYSIQPVLGRGNVEGHRSGNSECCQHWKRVTQCISGMRRNPRLSQISYLPHSTTAHLRLIVTGRKKTRKFLRVRTVLCLCCLGYSSSTSLLHLLTQTADVSKGKMYAQGKAYTRGRQPSI